MDLQNRIGAWLTPDGCFFRVWAPNAVQVIVLLQAGPNWNVTAAFARHALTNTGGWPCNAITPTRRIALQTPFSSP